MHLYLLMGKDSLKRQISVAWRIFNDCRNGIRRIILSQACTFYRLSDSLFHVPEQTYGNRFRQDHIIGDLQRMPGVATHDCLRKNI